MMRRWALRLRNTLTIAVVVGLALLLVPRGPVGRFVSTRIDLHVPGFAELDPGEHDFIRRHLALVLDEALESRGLAEAALERLRSEKEETPSVGRLLADLSLRRLERTEGLELELRGEDEAMARRRLRVVLDLLEERLQRSLRAYLSERLARVRGGASRAETDRSDEASALPLAWSEAGRAVKASWEADLFRKRLEREGIAVKVAALRRFALATAVVVDDGAARISPAMGAESSSLREALGRAEAELAELNEIYLPAHPKVERVRERVEGLRRHLVAGPRPVRPASKPRRSRRVVTPPSAVLEGLEGRLALLDAEVSALERLLADEVWKRLDRGGPPAVFARSAVPSFPEGRGIAELLRDGFRVLQAVPAAADAWRVRRVDGFGPRELVLFLGFLLLLGALELSLRRRRDARWPDVLRRLPVLAALPGLVDLPADAEVLDEGGLLAEMDPGDRRGDALRLLEARLRGAVGARRPTYLALSQGEDVGQSVALAHLAIVMASTDRKVLLVDANMRHPRQHEIFHVSNERGLSDLLVDEDPSDELLVETAVDNLLLLPSGPLPPEPVELFSAPRCGRVFSALEAWADVILVDGAPLASGPESSLLAALADGTFFVTVPGENLSAAAPVLEDLEGLGHRLLGVVQNRVPRDLPLR